jgi:serine/threonine-protein kinase
MSNVVEQFGKYILLEKLASGGMAEVYLARSSGAVGVTKFVAIKRILPQYSDNAEFIDMFKEEAKITVNLNHGNVVSIYDFGIERHQFYLVMEYVEGRNLRQILNELKRTSTQFTIEQIVYMVKEVAAGLDHAHRCIDGTSGRPLNITHRDMSPQNIMVSFEGEVKIIDFGIAKAETQIEATKAGTLKGKFGYMSPEQADGQAIDLRTDVFSLGIVLWELLANDRLFTSNSEAAILRKIRECQIPSIRKINPSVPPELERIVNKSLAKDRSLRYQTAAAFHRDLNRFLNTEYPEFSPHDFSVFMKNAFSQAFLDQRKRLVEYSKIQSNPTPENDKTVVTQTDVRPGIPAAAMNTTNLGTVSDLEDAKLNIDTSTDIKVSLDGIKSKNATTRRDATINTIKTATNITQVTSAGTPIRTGTSTAIRKGGTSGPFPLPPVSHNRGSGASAWGMRLVIFVLVGALGFLAYKNQNVLKKQLAGLNMSELTKVTENITNRVSGPSPAAEGSPTTVAQSDFPSTAQYIITIESQPAGARIFIDGSDTGEFTPYRRTVEGNKAFALTLKKDGYLNYETSATATGNAQSVKATLQPVPKAAYISVNLINGGANPVLEVNGQRLNERVPIEKYTIPAGVPVRIHAHNPFTGATAEQTITVEENQKKSIELILK